MAKKVLQVEGLVKSFAGRKILNDVSLDVNEGERLAIIGPSGAGKSVLIKCIAGLILPDSGKIVIGDVDYSNIHISKREKMIEEFGMLFQGSALFDSLPTWQNVAFTALNDRSLTPAATKNKAVRKLKMVGLPEHVADLYPAELSGGMQKRVALARAIFNDPQLLFCDEPTSGLDPVTEYGISELILDVTSKINATCIVITHDMICVRQIADRVCMLQKGKIVWQGSVSQLDHTRNADIRELISVSKLA